MIWKWCRMCSVRRFCWKVQGWVDRWTGGSEYSSTSCPILENISVAKRLKSSILTPPVSGVGAGFIWEGWIPWWRGRGTSGGFSPGEGLIIFLMKFLLIIFLKKTQFPLLLLYPEVHYLLGQPPSGGQGRGQCP